MNIDVKMTYLKYLLLAGAMCAFVSCHREDGPFEQPEGKPIELSASSDWQNFTKGPIDGLTDLQGDGFVVWGNLVTLYDESVTVFDGTKVEAVFVDGAFDSWDYSPKQYWHSGTYEFAALLPANGISNNISVSDYDATSITLGGGEITLGGYSNSDESIEQVDLMYALSGTIGNIETEDTPRPDAPVELTFNHLWAQIGFNLISVEPTRKSFDITKIKIYGTGLYSSIKCSGLVISGSPENLLGVIGGAVQNVTDTNSPFATFTPTAGYWKVGTADYTTLVDELMVFPVELLESKSVIVEVTYGNNKTISGEITSGKWLSGSKYVYNLQLGANSIIFGEPTVTDWTGGENFEIDIEIDKQENNEE